MHVIRRSRTVFATFLSFLLLLTAFLSPASAAAASEGHKPVQPALSDEFAQQLQTTPDDESLSVIVYLRRAAEWAPRTPDKQGRAEAIATAKQGHARDKQQFLNAYKLTAEKDFWLGNAVVLTAPAKVVRKMARDPQVYRLVPNATLALLPPVDPGTEPEPQVDPLTWGVAKINAPAMWNRGFTGQGVTVAVIDTGIYAEHPDLAGRVVGWYDAVNGRPEPYDDKGHGTHVAGTIAGRNTSGTAIGVAPDANLVGVKVLDSAGHGPTDIVVEGMQWTAEFSGADVFNMSLGGMHQEAFAPALEDLVRMGIFPAISAGNDGPSAGTIGSPADFPLAFTVGATDSADQVAGFSSRGPVITDDGQLIVKPNVVAPGVAVLSAWPNGGYSYLNGTSMAAPHVAGAAALLKQAAPGATVEQLKQYLMHSAVPLAAQVPNYDSGWGRIDVEAAYLMQSDSGTLTGTVTNAATGKALGDAMVTIQETGEKLYTGRDGRFSTMLRAGVYTLTADAYLFHSAGPVTVTIAPQQTVLADFAMQPNTAGSVQGRVTDIFGRPVISATVSVELPTITLTALTDMDGNFFLEQVPTGLQTVKAKGPIAPTTVDVTVEEGRAAYLALTAHRSVIAQAMLGGYNSRDVLLAAAPNGTMTVAGISGNEYDRSTPNLFSFDSEGRYGWTARLGDNVTDLAVSANGQRIAVTYETVPVYNGMEPITAAKGGGEPWPAPTAQMAAAGISVLDAAGQVLFTVPASEMGGRMAIAPDGSLLAYASYGALKLYDGSGALLATAEIPTGYQNMLFSADGKTLALTSGFGEVILYEVAGSQVRLAQTFDVMGMDFSVGAPRSFAMNGDASMFVMGHAGRWTPENRRPPGQVRAYDRTGALLWAVETDRNVEQVAVSRDGRTVAAGSIGGTLYVINGQTGSVRFTRSIGTSIDCDVLVAVSPEGDRVAASYQAYHQTEVYDLAGRERFSQFTETRPLALAGFDNLTRLVVTGPAVENTRMTPMEVVVMDTPDAAFADLAHRSVGPVQTDTIRYGKYGQDYYYDMAHYRATGEMRLIFQPAPKAGAAPAASIEAMVTGSSRVILKAGTADPVFLSASGQPYADGTTRETAASVMDLTKLLQPGTTEWTLQTDAGGPEFEPGLFVIRRY